MYIGREEEKNMLSYVDFTILCNIISRFPDFYIDSLINGINFPISSSKRDFKQRETFLFVWINM